MLLMPDFPMRDRIFTVQYYIDANYKTDLKVSQICEDIHINPSHFSRMFKTYIGMSPKQYLTQVRLRSVKRDLLMTNRSITDIALDNGFVDVNNFTRIFRKSFGLTEVPRCLLTKKVMWLFNRRIRIHSKSEK